VLSIIFIEMASYFPLERSLVFSYKDVLWVFLHKIHSTGIRVYIVGKRSMHKLQSRLMGEVVCNKAVTK